MKKFFVLGLGVIFALQSGVAFAAIHSFPPQPMEPAMTTLLSFNRWLYGNNFYGTSYINDNLDKSVALALKWDPKATLSSVDITYQDPDQPDCSFVFGSLNQPTQVFKTDCVDLSTQQVQGQAAPSTTPITADNLFGVPTMKQRKFVSDILASTSIMNQITTYMHGTSEANVEFTLSKVNSQLMWKWGISDGHQLGMDIQADASQLNSPLVFQALGS